MRNARGGKAKTKKVSFGNHFGKSAILSDACGLNEALRLSLLSHILQNEPEAYVLLKHST
jgi:hypothetical protein